MWRRLDPLEMVRIGRQDVEAAVGIFETCFGSLPRRGPLTLNLVHQSERYNASS